MDLVTGHRAQGDPLEAGLNPYPNKLAGRALNLLAKDIIGRDKAPRRMQYCIISSFSLKINFACHLSSACSSNFAKKKTSNKYSAWTL